MPKRSGHSGLQTHVIDEDTGRHAEPQKHTELRSDRGMADQTRSAQKTLMWRMSPPELEALHGPSRSTKRPSRRFKDRRNERPYSGEVRAPNLRETMRSSASHMTDARSDLTSSNNEAPSLVLADADLWEKFHRQQNEMIVTNSGRCLFPCLRLQAVNLNPSAIYSISLDFEKIEPYRFRFLRGQWAPVPMVKRDSVNREENTMAASVLAQESYMHPDLLQDGNHWMQGSVSFAKIKLSNKFSGSMPSRTESKRDAAAFTNGIFHLVSFHKYRPRVHLTEHFGQSQEVLSSATFTFDTTAFIAVTHYQNYKLNDLKKGFNPHARGFRDTIGQATSQASGPKRRSIDPLHPRSRSCQSQRLRIGQSRSAYPDGPRNTGDDGEDNEHCEEWSPVQDVEEFESDGRDEGGLDEEKSDNEWRLYSRTVYDESDAEDSADNSNGGESGLVSSRLCRVDKDNKSMVKISLVADRNAEGRESGCNPLPARIKYPSTAYPQGYAGGSPFLPKPFEPPSTAQRNGAMFPSLAANEFYRLQELLASALPPLSDMHTREANAASIGTSTNFFQTAPPASTLTSFPSNTNIAQCRNTESAVAQLGPEINMSSGTTSNVPPSTTSSAQSPIQLSWYQQFFWDQPPLLSSSSSSASNDSPALGSDSAGAALQLQLQLAMKQTAEQEISSSPACQTLSRQSQQQLANTPMCSFYSSTVADSDGRIVQEHPTMDQLSFAAQSTVSHFGGNMPLEYNLSAQVQQAHADPRVLKTTILESKTLMSKSSIMSLSPFSAYSSQVHLERAIRENHCLKAFIRERFGK
ncbi:hypothetical protein EDD11_004556 [Mortierella claussenii]|nr:hypothetical protein EDD11_004556 [Mortierella claussenii]